MLPGVESWCDQITEENETRGVLSCKATGGTASTGRKCFIWKHSTPFITKACLNFWEFPQSFTIKYFKECDFYEIGERCFVNLNIYGFLECSPSFSAFKEVFKLLAQMQGGNICLIISMSLPPPSLRTL